uniref:Small integral membrane protein 12 n=1 Tax=Molossus molossus TaxID=27622 RepID=A0A7J8K100_MOLMO|nr:hypothetical protein HJG59_017006 [Molossus molossus]
MLPMSYFLWPCGQVCGYHLGWVFRGKEPQPVEEDERITEHQEDRKLDELLGKDYTQVVSLKDKLEFTQKLS